MDVTKQKTKNLGLRTSSETVKSENKGMDPSSAKPTNESPNSIPSLMEEILDANNLRKAAKRVIANKGSAGVDGMTVEQLPQHLQSHWPKIKAKLAQGKYKPAPIRRVEIPKPTGGVRKLGIPTVVDRFIQQAVLQVLQVKWDASFSDNSYGFRPNRSAHQAIDKAQSYIKAGYYFVVDMDLEKFFDRVNHDVLMGRIARRIGDKRVLKLIRSYLNAGVLECGLVTTPDEGTPQGGPLSPLLSNVMLDDLDKELERRGHKFVRYADDCNIYVKTERSGMRVMSSVGKFLLTKLKLVVNEEKSAVARSSERKFLGFSFGPTKEARKRIAPQSIERMKKRVRSLTRRTYSVTMQERIGHLNAYLKGWRGYFGKCETPWTLRNLDGWIRRRLRCVYLKQWPLPRTRYEKLRQLGACHSHALSISGSRKGYWRLSKTHAMHTVMPPRYFDALGLTRLAGIKI